MIYSLDVKYYNLVTEGGSRSILYIMCLLKTGICYHSLPLCFKAVLFPIEDREKQMPHMIEISGNVEGCLLLPLLHGPALGNWATLVIQRSRSFPFLWEGNSSREVWSQPFHGRNIPKPVSSFTPGRDIQFAVWQPCPEPSPRRQIPSVGWFLTSVN